MHHNDSIAQYTTQETGVKKDDHNTHQQYTMEIIERVVTQQEHDGNPEDRSIHTPNHHLHEQKIIIKS